MFSFGVEQVIYPRYWFIHHIMQGCARGNDRVRGVYLGLLLAFAVTAFCGVFRRSLRTYVKHSRIAGGIAGIAAAATAAFCGGMRRERYGKSCWPFAFCLCFYGVLQIFFFALLLRSFCWPVSWNCACLRLLLFLQRLSACYLLAFAGMLVC